MNAVKRHEFIVLVLVCLFLFACRIERIPGPGEVTPTPAGGIQVTPLAEYQPDADCSAQVRAMRANSAPGQWLPDRYRDLRVIDAHNHGAADSPTRTVDLHDEYFFDGTVLFGNISEPAAQKTDEQAFQAYRQWPGKVTRFFAGIPLEEQRGVAMARENLEKGFYGIGEIVGASTYSPMTAKLPWKAQHPNSGILPEIYQLSAEYHAPVLLHIDPPDGEPIEKLEQALKENPRAIIIFGHANAYNPPGNIERLVRQYPNLTIDFFAGFTALNPESTNTLADFVPLIERYPGQFLVSTDSGYGVGEGKALEAIYELLDVLTPETVCKVSHQNFEAMVELQPATEAQVAQIRTLSKEKGLGGTRQLNKREANELIFEMQGK